MNGPQHLAEADLLLSDAADLCSYGCPHSGCAHELAGLIRAQAHATLALAAATALAACQAAAEPSTELDAWRKALAP